VSRVRFFPPAWPTLRSLPPTGEHWQYELNFDGYRVQLHKTGAAATIFSKNGADFARRFPTIAAAVLALPLRSCIIDGELIAADVHGQPDFLALLHGRHVPACVYAFDLLQLQGRDLRNMRLEQRRARLKALLARSQGDLLRFSESFPDGNILLAECARLGLEAIVCKRKDSVYRSGPSSGWVKVKTRAWKLANKDRGKLFEKG
jgi:bifunctional non-homologous end joining protein LigD